MVGVETGQVPAFGTWRHPIFVAAHESAHCVVIAGPIGAGARMQHSFAPIPMVGQLLLTQSPESGPLVAHLGQVIAVGIWLNLLRSQHCLSLVHGDRLGIIDGRWDGCFDGCFDGCLDGFWDGFWDVDGFWDGF